MKRIVILAAVVAVALVAYAAGAEAEKAKKKFAYLSDRLNETITMTRAELACKMYAYRPTEPWKSGVWLVTKIETSLEPKNISVAAQVVLMSKSRRTNYRSKGHLTGCVRAVHIIWMARILRQWVKSTRPSTGIPVVVKIYEGKRLLATMGLPTRDPFGKLIPGKIVTIADKGHR